MEERKEGWWGTRWRGDDGRRNRKRKGKRRMKEGYTLKWEQGGKWNYGDDNKRKMVKL